MKYLCGAVNDNGRFVYCRHTDPSKVYSPERYNIVRHSGAVYAMLEGMKYYPEAKDKAQSAAKYLVTNYLVKLSRHPKCHVIISKPQDKEVKKRPVAKLGASALALCALTPLYNEQEKIVSLEQLRGLGEFLLMMQNPDGSSYSKYRLNNNSMSKWISLYYPGEAALGLVKLYGVDPNDKWIAGAKNYLLFLAKQRQYAKEIPMDHWSIIAAEELFRIAGNKLSDQEKKQLVTHALQVANSYIFTQNLRNQDQKVFGSFMNGLTCPTATRLEGLVALRKLIGNTNTQKQLDRSIRHGLNYLMNAQITSGPLNGGIPRATAPLPTAINTPGAEIRMGEIRIDYVQHAICAMMNYMPYIRASKSKIKK